MSKFVLKTVIAAKLEVTPGTDIVPGAADCILVRNPVITPLQMSYAERQLVRGFFGNPGAALPTIRKVGIQFEVELAGGGTPLGTLPAYDGLLQACAHSSTVVATTSVTYAPLSPGVKTISIYYNVDGTLHKIVFGRGSVTFKVKANDIPVMAFDIIGLDSAVTDTAILVPSSFGSYKAPVPATKANTPTITIHGAAVALENFELNVGNVNEQISRPGNEAILNTDRKAVGTLEIEMTTVATKDWMGEIRSGIEAAVQLIHGTVGGNIITINGPNVQLTNPKFSNQQGIQMLTMDMRFDPSAAGNDEYSIVLT